MHAKTSSSRDVTPMYIDYSTANGDDHGYVFQFNSDYTGIDTADNYAAVSLAEIAGYTDYNNPSSSIKTWQDFPMPNKYPSTVILTIDSIFAYITQENNSNQNDSIDVKLITTTAGAPSTSSTVLWHHGASFNTALSPSGNWLGTNAGTVWFETPNYTTNPGQVVAIQFDYYDPSKMDTASIAGNYVQGNTPGQPDSVSHYPYSYMRYPPFLNNIIANVNVVSGGTPYSCQNWFIWAAVHVDFATGIVDNFDNLKVHGVSPNPATGEATVSYGLNKDADVTIDLYDLSGKLVKNFSAGNATTGAHYQKIDLSDVNAGMYLVSVKAGNGLPVTSKLVVSH